MTTETKKLSAAIGNAIDCLPAELCRLTADYAVRRPHSWTPVAGIDVVSVSDKNNQTKLIAEDAGCWRLFASSVSLAVGHLEWTADVDWLADAIGFGVTALPGNRTRGGIYYQDAASSDDWIVFPDIHRNELVFVHDGQRDETTSQIQIQTVRRLRVQFIAYPSDRTVVASLFESTESAADDGDWRQACQPIAILNAESQADFDALRPCVVVGACAGKTVVRSGR
jgi:hypothetical protein